MKCLKCGTELYENTQECVVCGYSEIKNEKFAENEKQKYLIFKNPKINKLYLRLFGNTEKVRLIKYLKYFISILILIFIIYDIFFYVDISYRCFVKIRPSVEFSNFTIKKGIRYLKKGFPIEYNRFCKNVKIIDPAVLYCGKFGGGCFNPNSPNEIVVSTELGKYKNAALVIIHETCHVIQYAEKRSMNEAECYKRDEVIPYEY